MNKIKHFKSMPILRLLSLKEASYIVIDFWCHQENRLLKFVKKNDYINIYFAQKDPFLTKIQKINTIIIYLYFVLVDYRQCSFFHKNEH